MIRYALVLFAMLSMAMVAKSQPTDTLIRYFKDLNGIKSTMNRDSAQLIRVIMPPDKDDDRVNVREFDTSGHLLFMGKYDTVYNTRGYFLKSGTCITFFPNGKRKSVINYKQNNKQGDEYGFFLNGRLHYYVKNNSIDGFRTRVKYVECYDTEGNAVCREGTGRWLIYNDSLNKVSSTGPIKNGLFDGAWNGTSQMKDSIKYSCLYKDGVLEEGTGFDKNGHSYRFTQEFVGPTPPRSTILFLAMLRSHLKIPRDKNGKKLILDDAIISFIVEKDGTMSSGEILNNDNPEATAALNISLSKVTPWIPIQHYGVPFRAKITVRLYENGAYLEQPSYRGFAQSHGYVTQDFSYMKSAQFRMEILNL